MVSEIQRMVEELTTTGSPRAFYPSCPIGSKLNDLWAGLERRAGESPEDFMDRRDRKMRLLASRYGWSCLDLSSCISCRAGREQFKDDVAARYPFWVDTHIDALLNRISKEGPDRELLPFCEIGKQVTGIITTTGLDGEALGAALHPLLAHYDCMNTATCLHCERGQGLFHTILLDLCERGDRSEWAEELGIS